MGNAQSQRKRYLPNHGFHKLTTTFSSPALNMDHSLQAITTPPGSIKSPTQSLNNSRRTSLVGELKLHINKVPYKSASNIDVLHSHEGQSKNKSGRSHSAAAEQFTEKLSNTDNMQTKINGRTYQTVNNKYCLPIDEEEQDRLTNTVCLTTITILYMNDTNSLINI